MTRAYTRPPDSPYALAPTIRAGRFGKPLWSEDAPESDSLRNHSQLTGNGGMDDNPGSNMS